MVKFGYGQKVKYVAGGIQVLILILMMILLPFAAVILSLVVAAGKSNRMLDEFIMNKNYNDQ